MRNRKAGGGLQGAPVLLVLRVLYQSRGPNHLEECAPYHSKHRNTTTTTTFRSVCGVLVVVSIFVSVAEHGTVQIGPQGAPDECASHLYETRRSMTRRRKTIKLYASSRYPEMARIFASICSLLW